MEKVMVFDTGSIISLTANNLLWTLEPLKKKFGGKFVVTRSAKKELIDKPLTIKRFEFEALQILHCFKTGTLTVVDDSRIYMLAKKIESVANTLVIAHDNPVMIVSKADSECIAATIILKAESLVVDERTIRLLVEERPRIRKIMEGKLRTSVRISDTADRELSQLVRGAKVIRSFELVAVAFQLGLLDEYLPEGTDAKRTLLDALLWGVKTDGCAVSEKEIRLALKELV